MAEQDKPQDIVDKGSADTMECSDSHVLVGYWLGVGDTVRQDEDYWADMVDIVDPDLLDIGRMGRC